MEERTAVKRRGILAAAGAVVAGMVATKTTQPVGAASNVVLGGPNTESVATTITNTDNTSATALVLHCDAASYGFGLVATGSGYGIQGTGGTYAGVFGDTSNSSGAGVTGLARSSLGGYGVTGSCDAPSGIGVAGSSANGIGVLGQIPSGGNTANLSGVRGINYSTGAGGVGVRGTASNAAASAYGVLGEVQGGNGASAVGVFGFCSSAQPGNGVYGAAATGNGVVGSSGSSGYAGIVGSNGGNAATGKAGLFFGDVAIAGHLTVNGTVLASLAHTDGSRRVVYSESSAEQWLADYGRGTLAGGKADVAVEPTFRDVADLSDYHIFLTPGDGVGALRYARRTAKGFAVEEIGGASSGTFSWRIVAKPRDNGGKVQRLATVEGIPAATAALATLPPPPPAVDPPVKDAGPPPTAPPRPDAPPSRGVPPAAAAPAVSPAPAAVGAQPTTAPPPPRP